MRSWIIVTVMAVLVGVGGVTYIATKTPANPLLTATYTQFSIWYPPYCGFELYVYPDTDPRKIDLCVQTIIGRVEGETGIPITAEDIFNPEVKTRWKKFKGVE